MITVEIGKLNIYNHNLWNKIPFLKRFNQNYESNNSTIIKIRYNDIECLYNEIDLRNCEIFIKTTGNKKAIIYNNINDISFKVFIEFIEMLNVFGWFITKNSCITRTYIRVDETCIKMNNMIHDNIKILINNIYKNIFDSIRNNNLYNIKPDNINTIIKGVIPNIPYINIIEFIEKLHPLSYIMRDGMSNMIDGLLYNNDNEIKDEIINKIYNKNYVLIKSKYHNEIIKHAFNLIYNNIEDNKKLILLITNYYTDMWFKYTIVNKENDIFIHNNTIYKNIKDIEF